jgi:chromosome segregation ATPase
MRVAVGDVRRAGEAIDLRDADVSGRTVVAAVRAPSDDRVQCPAPGPVHEYVGHVHGDVSVPVRAAVAAAARSTGATAPQEEDVAAAESARADVSVPDVDLAAARERVASAGDEEAALRERVARLSGRVEARREAGEPTAEAEAALADAARALSESETERLAAEQALDRARERARAARDARERRLALADRADNLRREARAHLASEHYDRFRAAVAAVPGDADPGDGPAAFEGDDVTAALAVARMAAVDAPVVVTDDLFDDAATARERLDAPVVLV